MIHGIFVAASGGPQVHGEAALKLPDLGTVKFLGMPGGSLLAWGLLVCLAGGLFGLYTCLKLKRLPVHTSMREVSELIYETCKTYLLNQGRFLVWLWMLIAAIIVVYFWWLVHLPVG